MDNQNDDRPMYDAVCSKCGNDTQVPFQPSGDRPVYCMNCFKEVRNQRQGDRGPRQMYDATCATCGQPTQVPFEPTEGRPVYCREHFTRS